MLGGFEGYLVRKAAIKEKYVPFYIKWVSRCYSFLEQPDNCLLTSDQLQTCLNHLAKTCEDWQVKQAEAALRHYGYYLSAEIVNTAVDTPPWPDENQSIWGALEKKTRDQLRLRHRSYSTEKTYIGWLRALRGFVGKTSPVELTVNDMQNFLSSLAVERRVAPSTQNQALNALIFVYRYVLEKEPGPAEIQAVRANPKRHLPVVLTLAEIQALIDCLAGAHRSLLRIDAGWQLDESESDENLRASS